jgi:hypothetical protein
MGMRSAAVRKPVTNGQRVNAICRGLFASAAIGPHNNQRSNLMKRMKTISLGLVLLAGLLFAGAKAANLSDCCTGSACCVTGAECCEK